MTDRRCLGSAWAPGRSPCRLRRAAAERRLLALFVAGLLGLAEPGFADAVRGRVLRGLSVHDAPGVTEIHIQLAAPVRYLRHAPARSGDVLEIQLTPLAPGAGALFGTLVREALRPPSGMPVPIREITYEGRGREGALVEVRFERRVSFEVRQGKDLRSLVVTIPTAAASDPGARAAKPAAGTAKSGTGTGEPGAGTAGGKALVRDPVAERRFEEGRAALAAGELDRAVALFTAALERGPNDRSAAALELLGVARERKGQLAHARAEYERYLATYPEGEGAQRVHQRLEALVTARADGQEPLRPARETAPQRAFDVFGSVATSYRRDTRSIDDFGRLVADDSLFNDVFVAIQGGTERLELRSEASASYLLDFTPGGSSELRTNTLFLEARDRAGPLSGSLGRQSGNTAGVIGRYDGARMAYRLNETFSLSSTVGFPVDPFLSNSIETDRFFTGVAVDATGLWPGLDLQLFAIQQRADGRTDRSAVGGEFRYAADAFFLAGLVDYDIHFGDVNTGFLVANWAATRSTQFNLLLDYRNLPFLTTSNALLGQTADNLGDLRRSYSSSEIESLAKDRTARSKSASLGVTQQLSSSWQLAGDFTISDLSGTPASGDVPGFEGAGRQYSTFLQLVGTDIFRENDVQRVGLRYVEAETVDVIGLFMGSRWAVTRRIRLNPTLSLDRRSLNEGDDIYLVRPALRVDYNLGAVTFDAEYAYEWVSGERTFGSDGETGHILLVEARYDF